MAVLLAKALGGSVVGVCSTANLELVESLGADYVLDYTAVDFTDPANHPEKFDIVFDAAAKTRFRACRRILKPDGIYLTPGLELGVVFGGRAKSKKGQRAAFMATGLRTSAEKVKDLELLNDMAAQGRIRPVIDRTYGLDDIAVAHEYVETGRKRGNVLLTVSA